MKKILLVLSLCLLCACGNESKKEVIKVDSKDSELLKEVKGLETTMKSLDAFKISKVEQVNTPNCTSDGAVEFNEENTQPWIYEVVKDGEEVAYRQKQKIEDEIQYRIHYYKNGKLYDEFSQLPGEITLSNADANADYLILDFSIKAVDTRFFKLSKGVDGENTKYTITLDDAEGYNKAYPDDKDNKTCSLIGDYVSQEIEVFVDKDGYIAREVVHETIAYTTSSGEVVEKVNTITYEFYDLNVANDINFYFAE